LELAFECVFPKFNFGLLHNSDYGLCALQVRSKFGFWSKALQANFSGITNLHLAFAPRCYFLLT